VKNPDKSRAPLTAFYRAVWIPTRDFLMRSSPRWVIFLIDLLLAGVAFFFTYLLRFNFHFHETVQKFIFQLPIILVLSALSFLIFKPYKGVVRYTGLHDAKVIARANGFVAVILFLISVYTRLTAHFQSIFNFSYSVIVGYFISSTLIMILARMFYKAFYYKYSRQTSRIYKALIYGVDDTAVQTMETLTAHKGSRYIIEGFVQPAGQNTTKAERIQGIPIYNEDDLTDEWLRKKGIDLLVVTTPVNHPLEALKKLDLFIRNGVEIKIIPPPEKWSGPLFDINNLQSLDMEMLLERDPIRLDDKDIKALIEGKTVLVTGAAGSIGSVLSRQILLYRPAKLIMVDQAESPLYDLKIDLLTEGYDNFETVLADIEDHDYIEKIFARYRPDYVFHAAAYKHVPVLEREPYYGIKVNILATKNLMELAKRYGVKKFIQISTDKAVNPTNVMGATKRVAELLARCMQEQSGGTEFIVTRFGNVLGSNGSVVHRFKKQIERGGPVTVTHPEIVRYFMTIPEAAHLVLKAAQTGKGGNIYVFDMGEPVKIIDLAKKMIQLMGKRYPEDIDIKIIGLRPGEKIYEELLTAEERVDKTNYEKLYISKLAPLDCQKLFALIERLKNIRPEQTEEIIALLRQLVPEYRPQSSAPSPHQTAEKESKA